MKTHIYYYHLQMYIHVYVICWYLLLQNLLAIPICVMFCYYSCYFTLTIQRVYFKSSSFVDFLKLFAHHGRLASNRENPPSTKITIYSQQQKSIANFMPERAKECGINEDSVKHPSSLSDRLPQVRQAVCNKIANFSAQLRKSIVISVIVPGACRNGLWNAVNDDCVKHTSSSSYSQLRSIFGGQCIPRAGAQRLPSTSAVVTPASGPLLVWYSIVELK